MMIKKIMHLRQHMEKVPLLFTVIWYQLLCFPTRKKTEYVGELRSYRDRLLRCDYLYAAPRSKTIRGNVITKFILHVAQCITFNQTNFFTATLIPEARMKSLYSSLGFKAIKDFAASHNFVEAHRQFHYG